MPNNNWGSSEQNHGLHSDSAAKAYDPDRRRATYNECERLCVSLTAKMGTGGQCADSAA